MDLAAMLTLDQLVVIGDHLVRRPRPWFENRSRPYATIEHLKAAAAQYSGRGARTLRAAADLVRMSSDSPSETRLRLAFVRAGLPEPLANVPAREGALDLGEPDLHWKRWRVIVEHDGPSHLTRRQQRKDIDRGEKRRIARWVEVRTGPADLFDGCYEAVRRVTAALQEQGWPG